MFVLVLLLHFGFKFGDDITYHSINDFGLIAKCFCKFFANNHFVFMYVSVTHHKKNHIFYIDDTSCIVCGRNKFNGFWIVNDLL